MQPRWTRKRLATHLATELGLSKKEVDLVLSGFLGFIEEAISRDEEVQLTGFGTFSLRQNGRRAIVMPQGNKCVASWRTRNLRFKPSESLVKRMNDR